MPTLGLLWPAMFTPRLMPIGLLQLVTETASSVEGRRKKRHEDRSPIEPRRYCEPGMFLPNAPFSGKLGKRLGDLIWVEIVIPIRHAKPTLVENCDDLRGIIEILTRAESEHRGG
jgi:hypothetical protein